MMYAVSLSISELCGEVLVKYSTGGEVGKAVSTMFDKPFERLVFVTIVNGGTGYETCHENNGATIYVGRAATVHNPLF